MPLAAGARLGVYEVLAKLGEGGMGEVYRARDTRLDRDVALKILPESFAGDPDRLMRFEREAKTLAALNHPNIAAIYGIEERALVMELVEGEDLSARIARGPLLLAEALPIAKQIADALEAAHDAGIIHRDLKPANIKVRADGTVKVLDFGLAKAVQDLKTSGPQDLVNLPTITSPAMTMHGVILGTAAYMSPEQASGKPVDKRSDLWAFGVVLLEMLTGRRVFDGETVSHVIAAVLTKEPEWAALPHGTPAPIRRLLRRCLEKDRKRRLSDASDARLEIADAMAGDGAAEAASIRPLMARCLKKDPKARMRDIGEARLQIDDLLSGASVVASTSSAVIAPASRRRMPLWLAFAITAAAGIGAATFTFIVTRPSPSAPPSVVKFSIPASMSMTVAGFEGANRALAISPDGTYVVFATPRTATTPGRLMIRAFDQPSAVPIAGVTNPENPFISPDSKWVGYFEGRDLKRVPVTGGAPIVVFTGRATSGSRTASWGEDDTIAGGTEAAVRGKVTREPIQRLAILKMAFAMPE